MRNSISVSSMAPDRVQRTGCCVTSRPGILAPGLRSLMKFPLPRMLMTRLSSCSRARALRRVIRLTSICRASSGSEGSWLPGGYTPSCIMEYRRLYTFTCFNFFAFSDNTSASIGSPFLSGCITKIYKSLFNIIIPKGCFVNKIDMSSCTTD